MVKKGVLSILVRNTFGVLTKVAGLFGRRGFNIEAISAGETHQKGLTRISVLTRGDQSQLEQICWQVRKLEDVLAAEIYTDENMVERELCLIKIQPSNEELGELMQLVTEFAAKTSSAPEGCAIVEATGTMREIDDLVEKMRRFGIVEISRTGVTALERSANPIYRT